MDREERTRRIEREEKTRKIDTSQLRAPGYLTPQSDYRRAVRLHELEDRYKHHPPRDLKTAENHENVRKWCLDLACLLEDETVVPEGYEKEMMHHKLEEVMFWANASIARRSGAGTH